MSSLSDKEVLDMLADFPKHELTTKQRTAILKTISEDRVRKPRRQFHFQKLGAVAALLILALVAPILYFSNNPIEQLLQPGSSPAKEAQEGVYFALIDDSGKPHYTDSNYGIPNKVSLLEPDEWVAFDHRGTGKIMVFLWGKEFTGHQTLNIEATNVRTGKKNNLGNTTLGSPIYDADAHAVLSMQPFDVQGTWKLEFSVTNSSGEHKKVGEFSIYVKAPYVSVGRSATLLISQEDLYAGTYEEAYIEVKGENLPEQIELEITDKENPSSEPSTFTFKDKTDYITTDGEKISMYKGDFQIKSSGRYTFGVMGYLNDVNVKKPGDK